MKENQEFKSSSFFLVLGLVIVCLGIVTIPWSDRFQAGDSVLAVQKAEVAGYQIAQLYREATKSSSVLESKGRGPASISAQTLEIRETGTVGKDPWGEPYHYRLLSGEGSSVRVLVWSKGPNQKIDTLDLDSETAKVAGQPVYDGDDLGVVLTVR